AVEKTRRGQRNRHSKRGSRNKDRGGSACQRSKMRTRAQSSKQHEEHDNRQRSTQGGEPPVSEGIVGLRTGHEGEILENTSKQRGSRRPRPDAGGFAISCAGNFMSTSHNISKAHE